MFKKSPQKQGLQIIIVGAGKVGSTLIEQLTKEGHDRIIATCHASPPSLAPAMKNRY